MAIPHGKVSAIIRKFNMQKTFICLPDVFTFIEILNFNTF